jgi:hypothetical protein
VVSRALPIIGERAVFIFRKCCYSLAIRGLAYRGPYYKAHPLVAQSWGSKLDPAEWPRVTHLLAKLPPIAEAGRL